MCLALSQHHAALALSCPLLCLSITLLLLSHVPCFVSASRCSCSLMCLALSVSITLLLLSHVPCFVSASCCSCSLTCLALSQHHAALALSCTCFALSRHHAVTCLALSAHVPCLVPACHHADLWLLLCLVHRLSVRYTVVKYLKLSNELERGRIYGSMYDNIDR